MTYSLERQAARHRGAWARRIQTNGLANVEAIATSSPRLEVLILGFGDLSGSMGMRFGHELDKDFRYSGDMWSAPRVRMIAASRAAGVDAIDGPFGDFRNDKAYLKQATYDATPGAVGKWWIHPNQTPPPTTSSCRHRGRSSRRRRWSICTTSRWRRAPERAARASSWWTRRRCGSTSRCWIGRGLRGACRGSASSLPDPRLKRPSEPDAQRIHAKHPTSSIPPFSAKEPSRKCRRPISQKRRPGRKG